MALLLFPVLSLVSVIVLLNDLTGGGAKSSLCHYWTSCPTTQYRDECGLGDAVPSDPHSRNFHLCFS